MSVMKRIRRFKQVWEGDVYMTEAQSVAMMVLSLMGIVAVALAIFWLIVGLVALEPWLLVLVPIIAAIVAFYVATGGGS